MTALLNAVARRENRFFQWAAALLFPLLLTATVSSQDDAVFRAGVNLVLADASVTDSNGTPVSGLTRDQFEIKEAGKPRPITRFEEGSARISLVVVVDNSGSMRPRQTAVLRGVQALVAQLQPGDEAALIIFNEHVDLLKGFLASFQAEDWTTPLMGRAPTGQTALYDAILRASRLLETSAHERRVIVVLSDGKDTASVATREDVLNDIRSSNRLLYAIGLFEPGDPDSDAPSLRKLSETTGGSTILDPDGLHLGETFVAIMKDLRARYLLGFNAEAANDGKVEVRRISISAHSSDNRSLHVHARREYRIAPR